VVDIIQWLKQEIINGGHGKAKSEIHKSNYQCNQKGCDQNHHRTALQFTPARPRNFRVKFFVAIFNVRY
jgi:hypothetical protein